MCNSTTTAPKVRLKHTRKTTLSWLHRAYNTQQTHSNAKAKNRRSHRDLGSKTMQATLAWSRQIPTLCCLKAPKAASSIQSELSLSSEISRLHQCWRRTINKCQAGLSPWLSNWLSAGRCQRRPTSLSRDSMKAKLLQRLPIHLTRLLKCSMSTKMTDITNKMFFQHLLRIRRTSMHQALLLTSKRRKSSFNRSSTSRARGIWSTRSSCSHSYASSGRQPINSRLENFRANIT